MAHHQDFPKLTPQKIRLSPRRAAEKNPYAAAVRDGVVIEANMKRQNVDWIFCYTYNGLIPHRKLMSSIERFYTNVLPRFA